MIGTELDEPVLALLEQGESIVAGWVDALAGFLSAPGVACCAVKDLRNYVFGGVENEEALVVASHLISCPNCRVAFRRWVILREAQGDGRACSLPSLRELANTHPDEVTGAFARLSRRVDSLISPFPLEGERKILEAPVLRPRGITSGDVIALSVERPPRLDAAHRFRIQVRTMDQALTDTSVRVLLSDSLGTIEVGTFVLMGGRADADLDLTELCVNPGFFPLAGLRLFATRGVEGRQPDPGAPIETQRCVTPATSLFDTVYYGAADASDLAETLGDGVGGGKPRRPILEDGPRVIGGERRKRSGR